MNEHCEVASSASVQRPCILGLKYTNSTKPLIIGENSVVRSGSTIYADVVIGDYFQSGHNVLIRENTVIGKHVVIGTNTVIDGNVIIGEYVKIESNCYIPTHMKIGNRVFFGPNVTITNDRYPLKMRDQYVPEGPTIEDGVTLGAGVVIVPGITIGHDSFVAAGSIVTRDVPPMSLVVGVPGRITPLPEKLRERNMALSWMKYIDE